jgi:hypothetical protein
MAETIRTNLGAGQSLTLLTCGICYCAVVERYWDEHLAVHRRKGELDDAGVVRFPGEGGTDAPA